MSFNIALSGLSAATADLDTISNNIANANTTGFKRSRAEFGDVFLSTTYNSAATAIGNGVRVQRVAQQFTQGPIETTQNPLDLAINGNGFFTLSDNGALVYSRAGAFAPDADGYIVNAAGQRLQVYPPIAGSTTFSTGSLSDLQLTSAPSPPLATSSISAGVNLPASATQPSVATFSPSDPNSYNNATSVTIFDSLGAAHTASLYYVKDAAAGAWTLHTAVDGTELGTGTALQFDTSGALTSPAGGTTTLPTFTPTTGAAALNLTLDVSAETQYGNAFAVSGLSQDGYSTGQLAGVDISNDGVISARYSNGQSVLLGQVALANFENPLSLSKLGDVTWGQTFDSGNPLPGVAGGSGFGTIQSGALEGSNVDITDQLVKMLNSQRNFQANSQVISTQDQLTQTILNL